MDEPTTPPCFGFSAQCERVPILDGDQAVLFEVREGDQNPQMVPLCRICRAALQCYWCDNLDTTAVARVLHGIKSFRRYCDPCWAAWQLPIGSVPPAGTPPPVFVP